MESRTDERIVTFGLALPIDGLARSNDSAFLLRSKMVGASGAREDDDGRDSSER